MTNLQVSRRSLLRHVGCATGALLVGSIWPERLFGENVTDDAVRFRKTVIDKRFVAESVAVADVNRDGKFDIVAGNVWYEAPNWIPHEIAPFQFVDPASGYSNCFNSWMSDLDHDGWEDQIVIGMPGEKTIWRQNSRGSGAPWKEFPIWHSACNESPLFVDLLGNGKRVLVMGYDDDRLAWFEPSKDPFAEWQCHIVSKPKGAGSQRYSHGLGVGDVNGDGRNEILTNEGYYVAPPDPRSGPWTFVKTDLGAPCAQMPVFDVNHDGRPDVISSSAHERGIWWHEQQVDRQGFNHHLIDDSISQTHSLVLAKMGRSKTPNIITGKRFWAHGPNKDSGANDPALLVRFELKRTRAGVEWIRHVIDEDSGVGTMFVTHDLMRHGLLDIVVSNKKGVFLFEQVPM